jgi:chromosome segregation ATPase
MNPSASPSRAPCSAAQRYALILAGAMRLPASVSIGISETIQSAIDTETVAQEQQISQLMEVIAEKNAKIDDLRRRGETVVELLKSAEEQAEQTRKERDDYHRKAVEIADQRDRAEEQAAQYRGDSLKYKTIAPKLADCEKALAQVEDEAKELRDALQRIADYDAPDAHAMIEQARAVLAKYPARG